MQAGDELGVRIHSERAGSCFCKHIKVGSSLADANEGLTGQGAYQVGVT